MTIDSRQVRAAIDGVPDPELPAVSVTDLGMLVDIEVDDGHVRVDLVATFSGCPATALIRADVAEAVRALPGVSSVDVRFVDDVTWTPERISVRGRARLATFGIAPPTPGATLHEIGRWSPSCPGCGASRTVMDSPFGPTPCRSVHYCPECRNPFEAIKP